MGTPGASASSSRCGRLGIGESIWIAWHALPARRRQRRRRRTPTRRMPSAPRSAPRWTCSSGRASASTWPTSPAPSAASARACSCPSRAPRGRASGCWWRPGALLPAAERRAAQPHRLPLPAPEPAVRPCPRTAAAPRAQQPLSPLGRSLHTSPQPLRRPWLPPQGRQGARVRLRHDPGLRRHRLWRGGGGHQPRGQGRDGQRGAAAGGGGAHGR
jgi:hypothetical protein